MTDILIPIAVTIALILCLFLSYLITVVIHEFGHAIPALLFTKENVEVYIGSMGNAETPRFNLGRRLSVNYTSNPLRWRMGMVKHSESKAKTIYKDLIITVGGPLAPLFFSLSLLYACFSYDFHGILKFFSISFFLCSIYQLRNLNPTANSIKTFQGTSTYNDGYSILRKINLRKHLPIINAAFDHYRKNEFEQAAVIFKSLPKYFVDFTTAEVMLYSYFVTDKFAEAEEFYLTYKHLIISQHSSDLMLNLGVRESRLDNHTLALEYYNKALQLDTGNYVAHCNIGYTYNLLEQHDKAIAEFSAALAIEPDYSYAVSNMAISYLKSGMINEAKGLLEHALQIGANDAYTYKNWGIYYLDMNEPEEALKNLLKAKQLEPDTHLLEHYIKMTEERLSPIK